MHPQSKDGLYQGLISNSILNTILGNNVQNYTILYTNTNWKTTLILLGMEDDPNLKTTSVLDEMDYDLNVFA